jgi:hypothetical protein
VIGERQVGKAPRIGSLGFTRSALGVGHVPLRGHAQPERLMTNTRQEIGPSSRKYQKDGRCRPNGLRRLARMDEFQFREVVEAMGKFTL